MMIWIWIGLIVIFVIAEAITAQLVSIWFVIGSVAALVASVLTDKVWIQCLVFVAVSALCFACLRPVLKKKAFKNLGKEKLNDEMLIGKTGVVTTDINNIEATGYVKVLGNEWAARSVDGSNVKSGEKVKVVSIEGVKLMVTSNLN